jgi:hypothetical protein
VIRATAMIAWRYVNPDSSSAMRRARAIGEAFSTRVLWLGLFRTAIDAQARTSAAICATDHNGYPSATR